MASRPPDLAGVGADAAEGRTHVAAGMQRFYGMPFEPFEKYTLAGSADDIVAFLEPFVEAGAKTLSLKACGSDPETELEVIAEAARRAFGGDSGECRQAVECVDVDGVSCVPVEHQREQVVSARSRWP